MEVSGQVYKIMDTQEFDSGFRKRELVITTEEQYPQTLMIEFVQDRVNLLNNLQLNDQVKVSINLRGREWKAPDGKIRYFNTIQGWRIEKKDAASGSGPSAPAASDGPAPDLKVEEGEDDNLPF